MLKFYCALTGDDYNLVKQDTPASKKKIATMATALFVPVILWFISAFLMAYHVLDESLTISIISGLFASFLIYIIERGIIMANGKLLIALFRISFGLAVAALGSLCLDEVIFKHDIDEQLVLNKAELIDEARQSIDQIYSNELFEQNRLIEEKHKLWNDASDNAKKEADGRGGSGKVGVGEIAKLKLEQAKAKKEDYLKANDRLKELEAKIDAEKVKRTSEIESSFSHKALLLRIKAMFDLVQSDRWMLIAYIITTAIFFGMEFLVIIFKLSLNKTNYEYKVELIEKLGRKRMEMLLNKDKDYFDSAKLYPLYNSTNNKLKQMSMSSVFL